VRLVWRGLLQELDVAVEYTGKGFVTSCTFKWRCTKLKKKRRRRRRRRKKKRHVKAKDI
jgi:hypothetical protein